MKADVEAEVYRLRVNRGGGHMHLQDEHFNTWLSKACLDNEETASPKQING